MNLISKIEFWCFHWANIFIDMFFSKTKEDFYQECWQNADALKLILTLFLDIKLYIFNNIFDF